MTPQSHKARIRHALKIYPQASQFLVCLLLGMEQDRCHAKLVGGNNIPPVIIQKHTFCRI